jgi:hypothetical protein
MKTMTLQARQIWASPEGQDLMRAMLSGAPKTPEHMQTVARLKAADQHEAVVRPTGAPTPRDSPAP